jgi:hypothetical protein
MDADNLADIGHKGFTIDAQAMAAMLFDFATHPDYRAAVRSSTVSEPSLPNIRPR